MRMINGSTVLTYDFGKIAALATQFALVASVTSANAMPPKSLDLPLGQVHAVGSNEAALADWLKLNPAKADVLLEALVLSNVESGSANDTRPVDAERLASRFDERVLDSHAFVEQATSLVQTINAFQPLSFSAETRELARLAVQSQISRKDENVEDWASALVQSMYKRV